MIQTGAPPSILADPRWPWIAPLLACPVCRHALDMETGGDAGLVCRECGSAFGLAAGSRVLDLRCPTPKRHVLEIQTGGTDYPNLLERIPKSPPPVTYGRPLPLRVAPEFMSVITDDVTKGGTIVEIGGSSGSYRGPVLDQGFRFVTTDYVSPAADLLADAHALPFRAACADAVLMQAVSQAFENPFVAFGETARILRNGGLLLGTTDCCAVFASSFYNITPWGLLSVLHASGLAAERLWLNKDALEFCGTNPGYPALVKPLLRALSRLARLRALTPRLGLRGRRADWMITAGSLSFIARKSAQ